jgi:hypothetical protein
MFQSYPGRLAGLHRHARRLAAAVAAVTVGLVASAASIPAAFAQQTQATVHHTAAGGGLAGWQITLIGIGVPVAAAAITILVRRVRVSHRAAPSPNR